MRNTVGGCQSGTELSEPQIRRALPRGEEQALPVSHGRDAQLTRRESAAEDSDATTREVIDSGNANPDSNFRFDPMLGGTGGYIFNLKTTGLASGTYAEFIGMGDPTVHPMRFAVK